MSLRSSRKPLAVAATLALGLGFAGAALAQTSTDSTGATGGGSDGGDRKQMMFQRIDADANGSISQEEMQAWRSKAVFRLDADNDGKVTKEEVDQIIRWLTGYDQAGLQAQLDQGSDLDTFFAKAPAMNPNAALIKGVVCGMRVEEIEDPLMQKIRYLDKLIDELAKGKAMEKILRQ